MQTPLAIHITEIQEKPIYKFNFIRFLKALIQPVKNLYYSGYENITPSPKVLERYEWRDGAFIKLDENMQSSDKPALFISMSKNDSTYV